MSVEAINSWEQLSTVLHTPSSFSEIKTVFGSLDTDIPKPLIDMAKDIKGWVHHNWRLNQITIISPRPKYDRESYIPGPFWFSFNFAKLPNNGSVISFMREQFEELTFSPLKTLAPDKASKAKVVSKEELKIDQQKIGDLNTLEDALLLEDVLYIDDIRLDLAYEMFKFPSGLKITHSTRNIVISVKVQDLNDYISQKLKEYQDSQSS